MSLECWERSRLKIYTSVKGGYLKPRAGGACPGGRECIKRMGKVEGHNPGAVNI